jgi:hypothetical protein
MRKSVKYIKNSRFDNIIPFWYVFFLQILKERRISVVFDFVFICIHPILFRSSIGGGVAKSLEIFEKKRILLIFSQKICNEALMKSFVHRLIF